jgi:hypothetical protein
MLKRMMQQPALVSRLVAFLLISSCICMAASAQKNGSAASGGSTGNNGSTAKTAPPSGNSTDPDGGGGGGKDPAGFTGVSLKVLNSTTPPGGLFQFQLMLTEPKPIGHGSTRPTVPSGPVRGIALHDPIGQTVGVAVVNNAGIQINFNSPNGTFGTNPNVDDAILTIAFPIAGNATVGEQFPLSINVPNSLWTDPSSGQPYPQEITDGKLTIGGTLAISDVIPNGGVQPAGTKISVFGIGFTPDARVNMEGVDLNPRAVQFISPTQLDVVLPSPLQMDAVRVRVTTQTERSTYFTYFRAQMIGESTHPLVEESYPLFSRQMFSSGTLPWTRAGQQFTALALQNPSTSAVNVTLEMQSAAGDVLGTMSLPLPALSKISRDLTELFANPPVEAVAVRITASQPIQLLGLLGDDATSNVVPVIVSTP